MGQGSLGEAPRSAQSATRNTHSKVLEDMGAMGLGDVLSTGKGGQTSAMGKTAAGATHACWGPRGGAGIRWPTEGGGTELGKLRHPGSGSAGQLERSPASLLCTRFSQGSVLCCPVSVNTEQLLFQDLFFHQIDIRVTSRSALRRQQNKDANKSPDPAPGAARHPRRSRWL